jgi:Mn-dependent DtxR family transcriptional regulator
MNSNNKFSRELIFKITRLFEYNFIRRLFYSIKNKLRIKILQKLKTQTNTGFNQLTKLIFNQPYSSINFEKYYIAPLYDSRLIKIIDGKISISELGLQILDYLQRNPYPKVFRKSSRCYEEILIIEIDRWKQRAVNALIKYIHHNSLSRALYNMGKYLTIEYQKSYVKLKKDTTNKLKNPLDQHIIDILKGNNKIAVKALANKINVHPRTIYKSLTRLENENLINREKPHKIYSLNQEGSKIALYLNKILNFVESSLDKDVTIAIDIIKCLLERNYPVKEREIFEECLKIGEYKGLKINVNEFNRIRNDLKSFGIIIGNIYMGYTLTKEIIELEKTI